MSRRTGRVRRAINADSSELWVCLGEDISLPFVKVVHGSELEANEKTAIWDLFERNMLEMYSNSSFGWRPAKQKKEIFHNLSRFLLVYDSEEETMMTAFCMFRFENEEGENVVYCYHIQVDSQHHRSGIGKKFVEILATVGRTFDMEKIVLTVLKANTKAIAFYKACRFEVDAASPSLYLAEDDPNKEGYDYEIMSKRL